MADQNQIQGLPEGAVVGPPLQAQQPQQAPPTQQIEGLPEGAVVGPSLQAAPPSPEELNKNREDYLKKTGQWVDLHPSGWSKFKNWVTEGLISPETITTAMTGYTPEEIQKGLVEGGAAPENRKIVHVPGVGDVDLYSFFGGMMGTGKGGNVAQVASGQTSPLMVAALGAGHVVRALGAARTYVQAAQVAKVLEVDADAATVANLARVNELTNATKQVEDVQASLKAAIEARDAGTGTQEAVIAARNTVSEATANLNNARTAVEEASTAKNLAAAKHAIAVRNATEAEKATQTLLGRAAGKLPMLPEGAVTAANIGQKGVGATFTLRAGQGVLQPRQEDESLPDYIGRVAENGAYFLMGVGETANDIKGTFRAAKNGTQAFGDWYRARESAREATQNNEAQMQAKKDFMKAIPSGPGKSNYTDDDYAVVRPFLEDQHANVSEIKTPKNTYHALETARQGIEDLVKPQVEKYADNDLSLGKNHDGTQVTVMQKLVAALMPSEAVNTGFLNKGLKAVEGYNLTNPTVGEADVIRRKLNSAMRSRLQQNSWSISDAITSDPSFAAMYELDSIMRDGVYNTLRENGVDGAEEARKAEASIIKVRNAAERQFKNAEVVKRGTGEAGALRKAAAWAVKRGATVVGAGVGAKTAGTVGAEAGAVGGAVVGERAAGLLAPGDLSVEKLIQRSMKVSGAEDTRPTVTTENALPPAEKPTPHPRENTPLHAELAGFYGEAIGDTPYGDLEKRFMSDVGIKKDHGVPLEKDERGLLVKINAEKIKEIKEAQKAAEKEAEIQQKAAQDQAKVQKEALQTEEKPKGTTLPKPLPMTAEQEAEERNRKQKEAGAAIAVEEGRTPLGIKPVGSHVAEATEPIQKTPEGLLPIGHTDKSFLGHEFGHPAAAAIEGIRGTDIASHLHPEIEKINAVGGIGWQDKPLVFEKDFDKKYTPDQTFENTKKWLRVYMGGAAANDVLHGISFDTEHEALRGDIKQARKVLAAHDIVGNEADALIRNAFEQTKRNFLTIPGVSETIDVNSGVREKGLPPELHASAGRVENFQKQIKGLADENQNRLANGQLGGEDRTVKERQPGVPREGEGVVAEGSARNPITRGSAEGEVNHGAVLDKIKETHGVTNDTAGIQNGQSFITPEGQFVHLPPGATHADAITEAGGPAPGPENGHDNRPAFINNTGAIRVHLANERAGKTLAASVPAQGVQNAEQVGAIQQLVGKELPRTGNLRMERADVNAENKNEVTAEKAFPRVSDVPKMLKKVGALPPKVERSLMTAEAMKGMKEAREEEPVNNAAEPTKVPELVPALIEGGHHAEPKATYHEASMSEGNPWVRRSADPAKSAAPTNKGRQLMIQISSDLINGTKGEADMASDYYDKLYSGARPGYARMHDFWEIPQWQGFVSHVLPDADVYVVRNMDQAKDFLRNAKYDRVLASALDVNTSFLKDLAKSVPEQTFDVGGYVEPGTFLEHPNVKYHSSVENMTKDPYYVEKGIKYDNGTDYRHYEGSDVIPRLTMSNGCLHKCAFCVVEKKLTTQPDAVVDQQAQSMGKLGAKLVYLNDKTFGQAPNYQHLSDVYDQMKKQNPDFQGFVVQTTAAQMRKIPADWLKKSGIKYVELGIESYNDPILKEMHKPANEKLIDEATDKLRENNIALIPNILIGLPGETAETYAHTLEFLKRNKDVISHANIYNLAVYKDAELGKKLTTASEGDFNENVLEKSFHKDPEVHRVFAGDLYGMGQELLAGTPKPLVEPERSALSVRNGVKHINDLDENDLMFRTGQARNAIFQRAEESAKGGGFTVHPDTGHVPTEGHVIEVHPESREELPGNITAADVAKFHDKVRPLLDQNPELHLGGYGKQLNVSAVGTPKGAETVGNKLDQQAGWDARNQEVVPYAGKGEKREFPDYSLDQRLKELGARKPDGTPTNIGEPEHSQLKVLPRDIEAAKRSGFSPEREAAEREYSEKWNEDIEKRDAEDRAEAERSTLSKTDISKIQNLDVDENGKMEKGIIGPDGIVHTAAKEHDDIALSTYGKDMTDLLREGGVRFANYGPTSYVEIASKSPETVSRAMDVLRNVPRQNVELDYYNPRGVHTDAFYYHGTPAQVEGKFRRWLAGDIAESERSELATKEKPISEELVKKYGTTNDPLAHGFILADGRRIDMGDRIHQGALLEVLPPEERKSLLEGMNTYENTNKRMERFLQDEGAIRVRPRQWHNGKEVAFEIPDTVTNEQLQAMRQSVGAQGNDGRLVVEKSGAITPALRQKLIQPNADKTLLNGVATAKEFARISDVDAAVKELNAHPETERSEMATRLPAVRELSTGDANEDAIIKQGGGIPGGLLGDRETGVRMFHDPLTHTTLGFGHDETATPEAVQAKLLASRKEYAKLPENRVKYGLNEDGTVVQPQERSEMSRKRTETQPVGSTVKLLENPLKVEGTGAGGEITTADVGQALAAHTNQKLPTLEQGKDDPLAMVDRAKDIMRDEAKYQMAQNNSGAEWYTKDIGEHDKILGEMRPELKDKTKLSLFKFAEATLSAGHNPEDNFNAALKAWDHYHETGEFPLKNPITGDVWGRYGYKAYANALGTINQLIEDHGRGPKGEKGAVNWLLSNHPVSELKEYNPNVQGPADQERAGAVILGPKRGPFALNLHGREAEFTADQWVDRSWNRWMGTAKLDPQDPSALDDKVSPIERRLMKQSYDGVADELGLTTSSLQAVMWYYEQSLYDAHGVPTKPKSFSEAARAARDDEASTFKFGANAPLDLAGATQQAALDRLSRK